MRTHLRIVGDDFHHAVRAFAQHGVRRMRIDTCPASANRRGTCWAREWQLTVEECDERTARDVLAEWRVDVLASREGE